MWFGSAANLSKIPLANRSIRIGTVHVQPVTVVRDLGEMIDAELSMRVHVSRTVQTCFYYLRRLQSIRRQLGRDVTARVSLRLVETGLLQRRPCRPSGCDVGAVPDCAACHS